MAWIIKQLKKIGWWYRDKDFWRMVDEDPPLYKHPRKTIRQHKHNFVAWVKGLTVNKLIVFLVFAGIAYIVARCQDGIEAP